MTESDMKAEGINYLDVTSQLEQLKLDNREFDKIRDKACSGLQGRMPAIMQISERMSTLAEKMSIELKKPIHSQSPFKEPLPQYIENIAHYELMVALERKQLSDSLYEALKKGESIHNDSKEHRDRNNVLREANRLNREQRMLLEQIRNPDLIRWFRILTNPKLITNKERFEAFGKVSTLDAHEAHVKFLGVIHLAEVLSKMMLDDKGGDENKQVDINEKRDVETSAAGEQEPMDDFADVETED